MKTNNLEAKELMQIMTEQMRSLSSLDLNNKNSLKEISRAKEIFNGAGKIIKLADFARSAQQSGLNGKLLPESK
jgi:hypothetical protein